MKRTPNAQPSPSQPGAARAADLVDTLPWGVLVLDEQQVIRRVNQQAARWGGAPAEALLGQPLAGASLPPAVRTALLRLLAPGQAPPCEVWLPQPEQWVVFSAARQPSGWVLYGQDITAQKQREQQYQALAENTPDVLTRWTPDLRLRYANSAFAAKAGQPVGALLGHTFGEMGVAPAISGPYMAALQRVFDTGQAQEHYNLFPTPKGLVHYYSRLVPELRDGQVETVLGIARDITALRQAETGARRRRAGRPPHPADKYSALLQAMDQGFGVLQILFDAAGQQAVDVRYLELTAVFARQVGLPENALGRTARQLRPDLAPFWVETYGQVARTGQPVRGEHYVAQLGRWVEVHAFHLGAPQARQLAVLCTDISARKHTEEQLRRAAAADTFRLQLADALGPLTEAGAIQAAVARLARQHFGADRCCYYDLEGGPVAEARPGAAGPGGPVAGTCPLATGTLLRGGIEAGRPVGVRDVHQDASVDEPLRQWCVAWQVRAYLTVPVLKHGQPAGVLWLAQSQPRDWSAADTALAGEVAERAWAAVAQGRAAAALRASEERQAFLLQLSDALRPVADSVDIQATAARVLGQYLGADRAYYVDSSPEQQALGGGRDWHRPGAPSPAHRYPPGDWPMPWLLDGRTWVCHNVDTDPTLPHAQRAGYRGNDLGAAVAVPLLQQGQLVATLVVGQRAPRAWTPQEVALVEEALARTWVAVERARAEEALARSEEKYRVLFDSIDEGFTTVEVLFDDAHKAVDYRFLELNKAHEKITGLPRTVSGKRVRELMPGIEEALLRRLETVVLTGEPIRYEQHVQELGRWFDVYSSRVGASGSHTVANVFNDITGRKRREAHLALLADLSVAFAPLLSAEQIMARVNERLAGYLGLSRCHLATVDVAADRLDVIFDWRRDAGRLPSLLGVHRLSEYLTAAGRHHAGTGQPLVLSGQAASPLVSTPRKVLAGLGFGSSVDIPHLIGGQWRFLLTVARAEPGEWRPDEVELLQQLAQRIYTRLERAQAEAALQGAHAQLVNVLESTHDAFYALDAEFRFTYINQRAAQLWGRAPATLLGRLYWAEFPQVVGSEAYRQHRQVRQTGQPAHFETMSPGLGTWLAVSIYPSQPGGLSVFFRDITERKRAEERQAFLLKLSDALRPLADAVAAQNQATRVLGEHLGAGRVVFWEARPDGAHFASEGGYASGGAAGPASRGRLGGQVSAQLTAGHTVALADTTTAPHLSGAELAVYAALNCRACIEVPLVKGGRLVALLGIYHAGAHAWTAQELALAEETAERTWAAVERANAEAARRASEAALATVFEALPVGVGLVNADGRLALANQQMQRYLPTGMLPSRDETQYPRWQAYDPHGRLLSQADFPGARALRGEKVVPGIEMRYTPEAGPEVWAQVIAVPLPDRDGQVVGHITVIIDIDAQKRTQQALRLSEARLQLALQAGRMGSFEWTSEGHRISLSPISEEVLGLLPDAPIATSDALFALVHPDDRARYQAVFEQAGRTGEDFHCVYRIIRPRDGQVRWLEERGQGTPEPGAGTICLRGVHWDVSEPVLAQQRLAGFNTRLEQRVARRTRELQASRDLLQSVFDTSLLAISALEAVRDEETGAVLDFRLRLVSRELARETDRTDLVGKLYAQEYPGVREVGVFDLAVRTLATGEPQGMEYHYAHEGFDKWFACQFVKLGDGLVATNLDITERKTAEQGRLKNLRLLEQAEAVAGLGSWDYELATGTLHWSAGMYRLFGWPQGRAVAPAAYLEVVVADDRARAAQLVHQLATGAGDAETTLRLHVSGAVKTVRMKSVVLYNEQGQAVRVLGVDLDITELQRLEADNLHLRLRLRQQQALFEAVQEAQEAERRRIAESLHNGIGQILYATKLRLDQLHATLPSEPAQVAARREADQLLREAIRQTRTLSHELVPIALEEFGLAAALQDIGRKMSTPPLRLHTHVLLDDDAPPLTPALQMALYRMAQELAQNMVKHARGATKASLELETMPGWVLLRAEDNGPGFAVPPAQSPGLGLRSLRDRVALLGGQLEAGTALAGGAYVRIRIPLPAPLPHDTPISSR